MAGTRTQTATDVAIEYVIPDGGAPMVYCNHALAQVTEQDITLSLFQIPTPLGDISQLKSVKAHCLGRFVFTSQHGIQLFRVLQGILETRGLIERAVITEPEKK